MCGILMVFLVGVISLGYGAGEWVDFHDNKIDKVSLKNVDPKTSLLILDRTVIGDFGERRFEDKDFESLSLPNLNGLSLQRSNIKTVTFTSHFPLLTLLDISGSSVKSLKDLPVSLSELFLRNCFGLTNEALIDLQSLPCLKILNLEGNKWLTCTGVSHLKNVPLKGFYLSKTLHNTISQNISFPETLNELCVDGDIAIDPVRLNRFTNLSCLEYLSIRVNGHVNKQLSGLPSSLRSLSIDSGSVRLMGLRDFVNLGFIDLTKSSEVFYDDLLGLVAYRNSKKCLY